MRICYENKIDDLVTFNRYLCEHSPTLRRQMLELKVLGAVVILAWAAFVSRALGELAVLVPGIVITVLYLLLFPRFFWRQFERKILKIYGEGTNKGTLGPHELELVGDELIERTPFGEFRTRLQAVERVAFDAGCTYIFVSATMAHIIPHNAVSEGNPEVFVEALNQQMGVELPEPDDATGGGSDTALS